MHRVLKPHENTLKVDTNKLNKYFNETAAMLVFRKSMNKKDWTSLIDLFNNKVNVFRLQPVTYENIEKCIWTITNNYLTGYAHMPASFIKPVSELLVSPITFIINNFININRSPDTWELAKISTIPKIQLPVECNDYQPVSILPILSKIYQRTFSFELHSHVNKVLKDSYSTLRTLKLIKHYTTYYLRKQRCESLILLIKLMQNILFKTLPQYPKNMMEKLRKSCGGFV